MANTERGTDLDPGALKALAHPLRVKIFDLLSERGAQTSSTLAALVGETSGAMSYHLRALAAHGLIQEVKGRGTGRERWWERPKGRISLPGPDDTMTPSNRAAAQIVTAEFFRLRHETLMTYLNRSEADIPEEWRDAGNVTTTFLDLTADQMAELKAEIGGLIDAAVERYRGQSGPDVRRVTLRTELFDLPANTPTEES